MAAIYRQSCMTRKHAKEPETVRLSSNEGNNMKGARRRKPVRTKRIIRLTLIASAFYAVFAVRTAFAQPSQPSQSSNRNSSAFDRPDSSLSSSSPRNSNPEGGENASLNARPSRTHTFDGRFMRAQHRMGKQPPGGNRDQQMPAMQPTQQVDPQPPERPPRHGVMTADERRLLRQHIEEAVRDLYKR
jgi:hypothetical protein